jgi:hypothetical protein
MSVNRYELSAPLAVDWNGTATNGAIPRKVYIGPDPYGMGGFQVAIAEVTAPPSRETMLSLHAARKGKRNITLVVAAVNGDNIWLLGPDEQTAVVDNLTLDQGLRQLQSALDEPDSLAAYTRLGSLRRALDSTSIPGFTNNGLFASYHLRENVPKRADWGEKNAAAKKLLGLRHLKLIHGLGFTAKSTVGNALVLSASTESPRAVAVLLDETEHFESKSARFQLSPVAWGLNVAARQGVPWLIVLRKDQIRLYPGKDGVGVGQKGQVETFFEIDLAAIDEAHAALLPLVFSAEALEPNGTAKQLLDDSSRYAARLGVRLRERVYEHVVPGVAKAVAKRLPQLGLEADADGLATAYRLTLRLLFRLLFQAYAEDRGLLPAGRNARYDANSLKTIAQREIDTQPEEFSAGAKSLWFDLVQVWNAIDEGNPLWEVPAYNGGLFGSDPDLHPEGALLEKLNLTDDVLGPALQHMLIDLGEDGVRGPVDFRSLSVREFGTIYEGLLESSLSVTDIDLTLDKKGAWIPAKDGDVVEAASGTAYFHSASGERKATGSYFTPAIVVDHLIDRSLNPALDAHLERIRSYVKAGDEGAAARNFFDFRVADLAMGSGHFLVAAVDRIESRMRSFLADPETQVPGVNDELMRLAGAAKAALGRDEAAIGEVEPAALLRRQVARRCIYGLDINPLAVELSRLALWIHTFVPGLPMSSLDHGLVCANSLTGIGTIDEALNALQPKRIPGQATFFDDIIDGNLTAAKSLLVDAANASEASKKEVRDGVALARKAKEAAEPTKLIFDAAVAARLGKVNADAIFTEEELIELSQSQIVALTVGKLAPAHMPYLFPEVFIRENPGFDVLLGNPPWEKVKVEEHQWWGLRIPGLRGMPQKQKNAALKEFQKARPDLMAEYRAEVEKVDALRVVLIKGPYPGLGAGGDPDLYQAFAWRNWHLLREGGRSAIVLPRGALSGSGLSQWRRGVLNGGSFADVCFLTNAGGWIFESVHNSYTVGLTVIERGGESLVRSCGPFSNAEELSRATERLSSVKAGEFLSWSDTAAFPLIPDAASAEVFRLMKKQPRFDRADATWEFRPATDLHATGDKALLEFDVDESAGRTPVLSGASFTLWDPDLGKPYAYADPDKLKAQLLKKLESGKKSRRSAYFGLQFPNESLPLDKPRIAFRDIARSNDTRTTIACLIPPGTSATHKAPLLVQRAGDATTTAFLLGVMGSIPYDWYMRRWVELTFSYELLNPSPVPRPDGSNILRQRITAISGHLAAVDDRYTEWAADVGVPVGSVTDAITKSALTAELDALVALLYGLSEAQTTHIFETFHRGWDFQPRLDAVLLHYAAWKDKA